MQTTRRDFLKTSGMAIGAGYVMTNVRGRMVSAAPLPSVTPLNDPAMVPKFVNAVPNAMDPGFAYGFSGGRNRFAVGVGKAMHDPGLGLPPHPVYGYGMPDAVGYTWPGRTFHVRSGEPVEVTWTNDLPIEPHLLPVDTSLHWAYRLHGYEGRTIERDGTPVVMHLHGGHSAYQFDGNPEFFFGPGQVIRGPRWDEVPGGFSNVFTYENDQAAGTLWYHDHALGITRLNVYAGMAGFYIVRDGRDTGTFQNPLGLPAWPYEMAFAIQDRMYTGEGRLFYPAFPGDPAYDDFITGEGAALPPDVFPGGGPTALAEFFGDHMLVNGKAWPKADVVRRNYRVRLLNGCDSRFLAIRLRVVERGAAGVESELGAQDLTGAAPDPLPFWVIGSDQGLADSPAEVTTLLVGPGERYDCVIDFARVPEGARVIVENIGGDAPFGGLPAEEFFEDAHTDRVMAFDAVLPSDRHIPDRFRPSSIRDIWPGVTELTPPTIRKVALYEGTDEFGRLQPLLGTLEGATTWEAPYTETPGLDTTEVWEIFNATMDAHPIHLHLVHFEILDRQAFTAEVEQIPIVQHDGEMGSGSRLRHVMLEGEPRPPLAEERAPKDMVTVYPGEVARIKMTFDRPGRYVWHCHILSHEDHEMMRVLEVRPRFGG